MKSVYLYFGLLIVLLISFFAVYLPVPEKIKGIISLPGVGALVGFLFQLYRDSETVRHQRALNKEQNEFTISISSHMARVAFDKHVSFCEEYISEINLGIPKLFESGPSNSAGDLAIKLRDVRLKYTTWITKDITEQLWPFEKALIKISFNRNYINEIPDGDKRTELIDEMHRLFSNILELSNDMESDKEETISIGVSKIIEKVQDILGITELTSLRNKILKNVNSV